LRPKVPLMVAALILGSLWASCGAATQSLNLNMALPAKTGEPRLESALQPLAAFPGRVVAFPTNVTTMPDGKVVVVLVPEVGELATRIDTADIVRLAGDILSNSDHLIKIAILPSHLTQIARIPGVGYVRSPVRPQPQTDPHLVPAPYPDAFQGTVLEVTLSFGVGGEGVDVWDTWTDENRDGWHDRSYELPRTQGGISISAGVECPGRSGCTCVFR
jgi:hypothetical protein